MLQVIHNAGPFLGNMVICLLRQAGKDLIHIPYNWNMGLHVFPDFRRVDINMDNSGFFRNLIRGRYRPVAYAGAAQDNAVGLMDRFIGAGLSVRAQHPEIQRMLRGHYADSHHGGNHGDTGFFRKGQQLQLGSRGKNAAARTDQGPLAFL